MNRLPRLLSLLLSSFLLLTAAAGAEDRLAALEATAAAMGRLQPGLENFRATVVTDRIASGIRTMTASMPPDMPRPEAPTVVKYWRRGVPGGVILAEGPQTSPYVQKIVEHFAAGLATDSEDLLLPPGRAAQRRQLAAGAEVKSTETTVADSLLQRIDIAFPEPTDVGTAFYGNGLRLPRTGVSRLAFDIDARTRTVREVTVHAAGGLQLTAEVRYREAGGSFMPERVRVTSPDGRIDDLLEITFTEVSGYLVPATILQVVQRPDLQDRLEVSFRDYRINQPLPPAVEARLSAPAATKPQP